MKKLLLGLILLSFIFITGLQKAKADSVMLSDGTVINGSIKTVLGGFVEIKTPLGSKKFTREVNVGEARDIVEYGFLLKKRVMGEVFLVSGFNVEMTTSAGNLALNRLLVRNIILSQQLPLETTPPGR